MRMFIRVCIGPGSQRDSCHCDRSLTLTFLHAASPYRIPAIEQQLLYFFYLCLFLTPPLNTHLNAVRQIPLHPDDCS